MNKLANSFFNVVYIAVLALGFPYIVYAAVTKGKYREGLSQKLFGLVPRRTSDRPCIWLHGVSVGEINLLEPLIARLRSELDGFDFVISSTTKTGFRLARDKFPLDRVVYCPLDFSWAIRTAIRRLRPDVLVLSELELWPNLIRNAEAEMIDVILVNGRLSESSFRGYRRIRPVAASMLRRFALIAAQSTQYAERFRRLGADSNHVVVTGSMKFDGAETNRNNRLTNQLAETAGIKPTDHVFLAGSTQAPEERIALETFLRLVDHHPRLRLILVPRHPERFEEVAKLLDSSECRWTRRTQLDAGSSSDWQVLLVDTIGELRGWWGTADVGFVGGSFGSRGGQNMIEPAAYGVAVCFGPNTKNFREVVQQMLENDAAVVVHSPDDLTRFVDRVLSDHEYRARMTAQCRSLVRQNMGALDRTVQRLVPLIRRRRPLSIKEFQSPSSSRLGNTGT